MDIVTLVLSITSITLSVANMIVIVGGSKTKVLPPTNSNATDNTIVTKFGSIYSNSSNELEQKVYSFLDKNETKIHTMKETDEILVLIKQIYTRIEKVKIDAPKKLEGMALQRVLSFLDSLNRNFNIKVEQIFMNLNEYFTEDISSISSKINLILANPNRNSTDSQRLCDLRVSKKRLEDIKNNTKILLNDLSSINKSLIKIHDNVLEISDTSFQSLDLERELGELNTIIKRIKEL